MRNEISQTVAFTLANDFHNSSVRVRVADQSGIGYALSPSQVRRVRARLCGRTDCRCGENGLKMRGPQPAARAEEFWNNGRTEYRLIPR